VGLRAVQSAAEAYPLIRLGAAAPFGPPETPARWANLPGREQTRFLPNWKLLCLPGWIAGTARSATLCGQLAIRYFAEVRINLLAL